MPDPTPDISIVVVSHRRTSVVACVEAIVTSAAEMSAWEVVVVADYPVDTLQQRFARIRWIYTPERRIASKRNIGIRAARAPLCAFTDDDCVVDRQWVFRACAAMQHHEGLPGDHRDDDACAGIEGKTVIEPDPAAKGGQYRDYARLETRGYRTNNIVYRRSVLERVGLFDERFAFQHEDIDLALRIMAAGYRIGYDQHMRVRHVFRNEPWELVKNCLRRRYDVVLRAKHPQWYRRHRGVAIPPRIGFMGLLHLGAITVGSMFPRTLPLLVCADCLAAAVLALGRTGIPPRRGGHFIAQWLSYLASPFVIAAALAYGHIVFTSQRSSTRNLYI
jgi:GT2 family glycosyltransferase